MLSRDLGRAPARQWVNRRPPTVLTGPPVSSPYRRLTPRRCPPPFPRVGGARAGSRAESVSERPPRRRYHVPAGTWDVERIILALRDWAELVGDPPRVLDWCPVERSEPTYRAHLWERHYPRWPEHSTVSHALGSWRQALIAAELPVDRPPLALPLQDRIAAARIMHAQGLAHAEIAAELGVHPNVIGKYLHAHLCKCGENYVVVGRLCTTCANRRAPARSWTREDLLAAILRWSDLEGRPPDQRAVADWARYKQSLGARIPRLADRKGRPARLRLLEPGSEGRRHHACASNRSHES